MANPYKDAEKRKKVTPGGEPKSTTQDDVVVEPKEQVVVDPPKPEKTIAPAENPLEGKIEQKQTGKPCGFYLSVEAIEKLEKLAKQNKCSKSKALDALLRTL